MQLTAAATLEADYYDATGGCAPEAALSPAMAEYDARRCAVCGGRYSCFGFGPPLSRTDTILWACGSHRHEVDRQLRASGYFVPGLEPVREMLTPQDARAELDRSRADAAAGLADGRQGSLF